MEKSESEKYQEDGQEETLESVIAKKNSEEGKIIGELLETGGDMNESIKESAKDILPEESEKFKSEEEKIEDQAEKAQMEYETEISVFSNDSGEKNDSQEDLSKEKTESRQGKENEYDKLVPKEELAGFRKEIEKKIEDKAIELNISKEKLIKLADLDLESLDAENLKDLNRGSLEFIRDSIEQAINEVQKNEKTSDILEKAPSSIDKMLKFISEHKKIVSVGQLAIYLSSFGPAVLKDLAGDNAQVEIYGEKISLKDLADNPELIKTIEKLENSGTPIDLLNYYNPPEKYEDGNTSFSFRINSEINDDNAVSKTIYFNEYMGDNFAKQNLLEELENQGLSMGSLKEAVSFDDFLENKEKVINIIAKNLNISENNVESYIDSLILPDVSKISVVDFENFTIDIAPKNFELADKKKEFHQNDSLESSPFDERNKMKNLSAEEFKQAFNEEADRYFSAEEEFKKWALEEKGIEDVEQALKDEQKSLPIELSYLKFDEVVNYENDNEFKQLFLEKLSKNYDIQELKEIAEKDPKRIVEIIAEVIAENVEYDFKEMNQIIDDQNRNQESVIEKHSKGIPYITLETGKGVCHDYGLTFIAAKNVLEEEGFPNLDRFVVVQTIPDKMDHLWVGIATADSEGNLIVTYVDPTFYDSPDGELNAVNKNHSYTSIKEKINEAHQKALEKIKDYNILAFQEKLKKILTEYDPRQHNRDHEIEGNKKLREQDENIEFTREEKTRNIKKGLENAKDKLKKIYANKDSENE